MATYTELFDLVSNTPLLNKVKVAISIAAQKIAEVEDGSAPFSQDAGAHEKRRTWVVTSSAFLPGEDLAQKFLAAMLATNNAASIGVIQASPDTVVQTNVETFVDIFAGN